MKLFNRVGSVLAVLLFSASAQAQEEPPASAIDVSSVTSLLSGDVTSALTAVGLAILALAALAIGFKWVKGLIFG